MTETKKGVAILGSTGSIGTQALQVIRECSNHFSVELLTAHSNADLLIKQAIEFKPNTVVVTDESKYTLVKEALLPHEIKVFAGIKSVEDCVSMSSINVVLTAMVGYAGLLPTIAAIKASKTIALANKETMVVAGELITSLQQEYAVNIFPVDSEHSAIFQCLVGEWNNPVEKIYLTGSGGPFRGMKPEELKNITPERALKHPNWVMGAKITIDSATLMNKGLEVIEAKWLFALKEEQIDVVIHPQSIIHSVVQFADGSMKAQLGLPDMKLPIQYALGYPKRLKNTFRRFNFMDHPSFTFEQPDKDTFRCLSLAYEAMAMGGNAACILNAANEVAVHAFLERKIAFTEIAKINEACLLRMDKINKPALQDYISTDTETRKFALTLVS